MKTQKQNPNGIHRKYHIQKIIRVPNPDFSPTAKASQVIDNQKQFIEVLQPVDKGSEYFILRIDEGGSDPNHIKACRIGLHAYADAIAPHLPQLAVELKEKYPLL